MMQILRCFIDAHGILPDLKTPDCAITPLELAQKNPKHNVEAINISNQNSEVKIL